MGRSGRRIPQWELGVAWFLAVLIPILLFIGVSGAHLNPAVTLALAASRRIAWREVPPYVVGQLAGAFLGSAVVLETLGDSARLGATVPHHIGAAATFVLEFAFTALLVASVFVLADQGEGGYRWRLLLPPGVVGVSTFLIGPFTGSSLESGPHDRPGRPVLDLHRPVGLPDRCPPRSRRGSASVETSRRRSLGPGPRSFGGFGLTRGGGRAFGGPLPRGVWVGHGIARSPGRTKLLRPGTWHSERRWRIGAPSDGREGGEPGPSAASCVWARSRSRCSSCPRWVCLGYPREHQGSGRRYPWPIPRYRRTSPAPGRCSRPPQVEPAARSGAALAFDPVEGLGVLFGGRAGNATILNDTWVDDGDTPGHWGLAPHAIHVAPPPLLNAAMAFDATLNEFLLFGGELADGRAYNGTWAFGSFQWTNLTANLRSSPPADLSPTMAFDPSTGEVVLVSSADPGATWTFGSGGWNQLPATDWVEPPVVNATAIEDPLFGGVLLFGGDSPGTGSPPLNGTWSFLDVGWVGAARPVAPPAEARPAMSYDPRIPGVLLYSSAASVSTWTYTATGWNPVLGGPLPPARTGTQLYYDSDAQLRQPLRWRGGQRYRIR